VAASGNVIVGGLLPGWARFMAKIAAEWQSACWCSMLVCGHLTDLGHVMPTQLRLTDVWCEMAVITSMYRSGVEACPLLVT